ncbi:hypothetical protein A3P64_01365 [Lactobacillus johnsonii]|uniref:Uncharacterized protein n=1 Tax=Lactobacillus johnsonii TaxID=33959 RepID=A0AAX0PXB4_LACJH|nr:MULTISPECIES: hypothetical protein [Lactobacillus]ARW74685.1 hypothetical protein A3P31_03575 [Lactobacillus johnsonii]ARW77356.1 hypothetical protein A3P32_08975 [Lactobacillus johnsonii]PAB49931.1 hypothetical protein A3P60_03235 [Lactobacillus johnsonii]PAB53553.1 hypothetical protein A3P64_01365 [Lactobacillus johnsonii]PEG76992.1 hypothetical protein CP370_07255 [Lactobacillus sp. UMNPBX19]
MDDIRFKERYIGFVFKNFKNPDSYLDYGSFNLGYCEGLDEEFADLTFRFNFSGKLMPDFWHAKDGFSIIAMWNWERKNYFIKE